MRVTLIIIFLSMWHWPQEEPKKDTIKTVTTERLYKEQLIKLDSMIATRQAEKRYNLKDTCK